MKSKIQKIPAPTPPTPRVWTSLDLINWTKDYFDKKGIKSARLEAELILASILNVPRIRLYVDFEKSVPPEQLTQFREAIKRRAEGREPLQYILGTAEFLDLKLKVTPAVLIPRPETEGLAEAALREAVASQPVNTNSDEQPPAATPVPIRIVDLCTGSGCLALYLASKNSAAEVFATDISSEALAVARENAKALNLENRVKFLQGDLFGALPAELKRGINILVSNPPYVDPAARDTLEPEVRDHEPAQALFADEQGLSVLRRIIEQASEWLALGGWMALEFGINQQEAAKEFAEKTGKLQDIQIAEDFAKIPRLLIARRKPV